VLWLYAIPDVSYGDQKSLVTNGLVDNRIQQTVSNGGVPDVKTHLPF